MKYSYLLGERTPNRTAGEFWDDCSEEICDLRDSFFTYLQRFYPETWDRLSFLPDLYFCFMRWPHGQSSFMIAFINLRIDTIVAMFPTFKKAAKALQAICRNRQFICSLGLHEDLPY